VRRLSNQLAKEKLGFEAKIDLREGLRRTLEWYHAIALNKA
jgi:nucleoside-diphosphate-sugar epimerase